jgi:hypothetical protein
MQRIRRFDDFNDDDRAKLASDEAEQDKHIRDGHHQQGSTASVLESTGLLPGELV